MVANESLVYHTDVFQTGTQKGETEVWLNTRQQWMGNGRLVDITCASCGQDRNNNGGSESPLNKIGERKQKRAETEIWQNATSGLETETSKEENQQGKWGNDGNSLVGGIQNTPLLQKIDENVVCLPKHHESNIYLQKLFHVSG